MTDAEIISALLKMVHAHGQGKAILREAAVRIKELTAGISRELSAVYERDMPRSARIAGFKKGEFQVPFGLFAAAFSAAPGRMGPAGFLP